MSLQEKTLNITENQKITLKEQVIFQTGEEGKRVWECGIVMSRYLLQNQKDYDKITILELGSGTGIATIPLLPSVNLKRLILTDYTSDIVQLLRENVNLQQRRVGFDTRVQVELVDWTKEETYQNLKDIEEIDMIVATDVIYKGSPYDRMAQLIKHVASKKKQGSLRFIIMIPKQRECCGDFLKIMESYGFSYKSIELKDQYFTQKAFDNEKESDKFYPGLKNLNFDLYTFDLIN